MGCLPASKVLSTATYDNTSCTKAKCTTIISERKISQAETKVETLPSPRLFPLDGASILNTLAQSIVTPFQTLDLPLNLPQINLELVTKAKSDDSGDDSCGIYYIRALFSEYSSVSPSYEDSEESPSNEGVILEPASRISRPRFLTEVGEINESQEHSPSNAREVLNMGVSIQMAVHSSTTSRRNSMPEGDHNRSNSLQDSVENNLNLQPGSPSNEEPNKEPSERSKVKSKRLFIEHNPCDHFRCKICFTNYVEIVLLPCGHAMCEDCAEKVNKCPFDRFEIVERKAFYCD